MIDRYIDASGLEADTVLESSICIIGGGVAGLTLAHELAAAGIDVMIVESGGIDDVSEFQSLSVGKNLGQPYFALHKTQHRQLGGAANRWCINLPGGSKGPRLRPLDPIDFEQRAGVSHSGWPIGYADLEPYYQRASERIGFDSPNYRFDQVFGENESTIASKMLEGTGFTPIVYKFLYRDDFLDTVARRLNASATVRTLVKGTIVELLTNKEGTAVTSARCRCLNGLEFRIKAPTFVLANGGIQAPRLLLSSRSQNSRGLGNDHDQVGRYFMEHLHFWSGIWVPTPEVLATFDPFLSMRTTESGMPFLAKLAPSDDLLRENGLLNLNYQLIEMPLHDAMWHPVKTWDESVDDFRDRDALEAIYRSLRRRFAHWMGKSGRRAFRLANMTEQSPNPDSRVVLSDEIDEVGQTRADLDWRIASSDFESISRTLQLFKEGIESSDLGEVVLENAVGEIPPDLHGGDHYMGTTRMHSDPRMGVVDVNSKVHGIKNLYIAGPSVFTTGGYANPIYTLLALTIRLADHLKTEARL